MIYKLPAKDESAKRAAAAESPDEDSNIHWSIVVAEMPVLRTGAVVCVKVLCTGVRRYLQEHSRGNQ